MSLLYDKKPTGNIENLARLYPSISQKQNYCSISSILYHAVRDHFSASNSVRRMTFRNIHKDIKIAMRSKFEKFELSLQKSERKTIGDQTGKIV